ncbi:lipocalin family protein [Ulvibacterium sp.]|uniref:lipocalin family protein n=1 Tax=Ulvibacterium sp. TaxID=2665914 RepID=UPI003BAD8E71
MKGNLFLFVFFVLLSCQNDSTQRNVPLTANLLHGSWQLIETYISPGGKTDWKPVENGNIFTFDNEGGFARTNTFKNTPNSAGTYDLNNNVLKITYTRDSKEEKENFIVQISENTMTLSPAGPIFCSEPCLYRYKRIN